MASGAVAGVAAPPAGAAGPPGSPPLVFGAPAPGEPLRVARPVRVAGPADVAAWIAVDLARLPPEDVQFARYLWIPGGDPALAAAAAYSLNAAVSRSASLTRPVPVPPLDAPAGVVPYRGELLRADLRRLAPAGDDLTGLLDLYLDAAFFDPYFHATLPLPDGRTKVQYGAHLGLAGQEIYRLTGRVGVVFRADWFVRTMLSTVENGLYYEAIGLAAVEGSDQDAYLRARGIDEARAAELRSDERAVLFRSNVTGRARRIVAVRSVGVRASAGSGLASITYDPSDEDADEAASDPIRNLLEFRDAAREVILERPNGLHEFSLFAAGGELQRQAPPFVSDHLIPAPHAKILAPAISCIRCHGPHDGWQPFSNDLHALLGRDLDVLDDPASGVLLDETLERLAGLYAGDMRGAFRVGRDTYAAAVFRVTGGLSVPELSSAVADCFARYWYDLVTPVAAARELGVQAGSDEEAVVVLRALLPPLPSTAPGVTLEDPIAGAVKLGLPVNRYQWELNFRALALRASGQLDRWETKP